MTCGMDAVEGGHTALNSANRSSSLPLVRRQPWISLEDLHLPSPATTPRLATRLGLFREFIYVGVGLAERRFLAEGLTGEGAALAQTARRWTRLQVPPFEIGSELGRQHWQGLLKATERQLVLARAGPGMLTRLADYLFERTTGHIGSFITLITRGCFKAIRTGEEKLTASLLDGVRIDEASEQARLQLAAAFAAGRLSATPGARGRKPKTAAS
jgi:hypothetical protein